jgi:hypothetical protein
MLQLFAPHNFRWKGAMLSAGSHALARSEKMELAGGLAEAGLELLAAVESDNVPSLKLLN